MALNIFVACACGTLKQSSHHQTDSSEPIPVY